MPKRHIAESQTLVPTRCALAVMMKVPRAGAVKTRLVPPLTHEEAAHLSLCFLRDLTTNIHQICRTFAAHDSSKIKVEGIAVYTPEAARPSLDDWLSASFQCLPQRGQTLDARLINAAQDLFREGFDAVCLIGGDSPTLPAAYLVRAVTRLTLTGERVVIGASDDGGYYLIGFKQPHHHLFSDIEWSSARVLAQTIERAADINLEVEMLPAWYDVDDAASLRRLTGELFPALEIQTENEIAGYEAAHTRAYLMRLLETQRLEGIRRMYKFTPDTKFSWFLTLLSR